MLSLLAIFIVNLVLLFALFKASNFIFILKTNPKSQISSIYLTVGAFILLFFLSVITTFGSAKLIANSIPTDRLSTSAAIGADLDPKDCSKLLDTIYLVETEIAELDNHRNIEETSPLFTIKIEYQKGGDKLREYALLYEGLELTEASKVYTKNIAQKMQNKANLFDKRIKIKEDKEGIKKILELLKQMDRVTYEQQTIIEGIERQCDLQKGINNTI